MPPRPDVIVHPRRAAQKKNRAAGNGRQQPADRGKACGPPWQVSPATPGNSGQFRWLILASNPGKARQRPVAAGKAGRPVGPVAWLATQSAPGTARQKAVRPGRAAAPPAQDQCWDGVRETALYAVTLPLLTPTLHTNH